MEKLIKYFIIFITINLGMKVELMAQPSFSIDSSFTPFLDFTMLEVFGGGRVNDVWENPNNGQIYLAGEFNRSYNGKDFYGNVCYKPSGSLCYNYNGKFGTDISKIFPISDSILVVTKSLGFLLQVDYNGTVKNMSWKWNLFKTVPCKRGISPYFYEDGSVLMANGKGSSTFGCSPINLPDTFPHSYIVKVNPQGFYDSTFKHTMNYQPEGFISYDSNRIFVYGLNHKFTQYDGYTINGLCRIFLNGDLDTTFENPILPNNNGYGVESIEKNGKFFIIGKFNLKDYPGVDFTVARFNPNGSLDTTFMNFNAAEDSTSSPYYGAGSITKTEDNGYLISGTFNKYQGYAKNGLVKVDSNGKIEPQFFNNFIGPDSSITRFGTPYIKNIVRSINGGYYVFGNFKYWNGQPSQPIIKIHGLNTSVGLDDKKLTTKTQYLNTIYPNPTNAIINLEWLPNQKVNQISMYDLQGRLIKSYTNKVNQINLESIENGIYFLKVFGEEGVEVRKIVKN